MSSRIYISLLVLWTNAHACIYAIHLSPYVQTFNKGCSSGWFCKTNHLKKDPRVRNLQVKIRTYVYPRMGIHWQQESKNSKEIRETNK